MLLAAFLLLFCSCNENANLPNVVIIYTDDIGYGDIGVQGATGIPTPNIDLLASQGIRFTDGHCAASTCSPSRYALLTGQMGFRKNLGIQGINAPASIQVDQFTMGNLFQKAGYKTAIVGKWHLGIGNGNLDWNKAIKPGPLEAGFDECFIIPYSNDRAPFVYVENHQVYNHDINDPITVSKRRIPDSVAGTKYPDAILNPESVTVYEGDRGHQCTVINGVGRIGYMKGGKQALWNDQDIAFDLIKEAKEFISSNKDNPFFFILSTNDIHAPRLPNSRFKGKSNFGYRGDNIVQLDWSVGQVMEALKEAEIENNTILIFTSDNGPVFIDGGYQDDSDQGEHKAAGIYRGGKYSIYEGGTRVPLIVRWPSMVKPKVSGALVSQVDLLASFGSFLNVMIPENAALDSRNYWDTFIGKEEKGARFILEQANKAENGLAIRDEHMKYIRFEDSKGELYDLKEDPSERNNLITDRPKTAHRLADDLQFVLESGLSNFNK